MSLTTVSPDLSSSIYFDSRNANDGGVSLACIQLRVGCMVCLFRL